MNRKQPYLSGIRGRKEMTNAEMIKKYNLRIITNNEGKEGVMPRNNPSVQDIEYIKGNLVTIIADIKAAENEEKEKEAATVRFYSTGWESHEIVVDIRKDVNEQLHKIASWYPNDCTFESLLKDYKKTITRIAEIEAESAAQIAKVNEIKNAAASTGEKQILRSYTTGCNDPDEECSLDMVTVWAMPDGTEITTRQHTW